MTALLDRVDLRKVPALYKNKPFLIEYSERVAINANLLFAIDNDIDIVVCAIYANRTPLSHITFVGVVSEYSGTGIGKMLVDEAINLARDKKMEYITIETVTQNLAAWHLYEKCGFQREDVNEQVVRLRLLLL